MDNSVKELLLKIKALADKGVDGEKVNAELMLNKLLKKHNLTLDDISDDEEKIFVITLPRVPNAYKLLIQITALVLNGSSIRAYKKQSKVYLELKTKDFLDIEARFNFFIKKYKLDQDIFYLSFLQKNLLVLIDETYEPTAEQLEKSLKARKLSQGLEKHQFLKQLEG